MTRRSPRIAVATFCYLLAFATSASAEEGPTSPPGEHLAHGYVELRPPRLMAFFLPELLAAVVEREPTPVRVLELERALGRTRDELAAG